MMKEGRILKIRGIYTCSSNKDYSIQGLEWITLIYNNTTKLWSIGMWLEFCKTQLDSTQSFHSYIYFFFDHIPGQTHWWLHQIVIKMYIIQFSITVLPHIASTYCNEQITVVKFYDGSCINLFNYMKNTAGCRCLYEHYCYWIILINIYVNDING